MVGTAGLAGLAVPQSATAARTVDTAGTAGQVGMAEGKAAEGTAETRWVAVSYPGGRSAMDNFGAAVEGAKASWGL